MAVDAPSEETVDRALAVVEAARLVVVRSFGSVHGDNPELVMEAVRLVLACMPNRPADNVVLAFDKTLKGD